MRESFMEKTKELSGFNVTDLMWLKQWGGFAAGKGPAERMTSLSGIEVIRRKFPVRKDGQGDLPEFPLPLHQILFLKSIKTIPKTIRMIPMAWLIRVIV